MSRRRYCLKNVSKKRNFFEYSKKLILIFKGDKMISKIGELNKLLDKKLKKIVDYNLSVPGSSSLIQKPSTSNYDSITSIPGPSTSIPEPETNHSFIQELSFLIPGLRSLLAKPNSSGTNSVKGKARQRLILVSRNEYDERRRQGSKFLIKSTKISHSLQICYFTEDVSYLTYRNMEEDQAREQAQQQAGQAQVQVQAELQPQPKAQPHSRVGNDEGDKKKKEINLKTLFTDAMESFRTTSVNFWNKKK